MPQNRQLQFRVDPQVVYRLGEELITDDAQALLELIKNCYDADASYARVTINTMIDDGQQNFIEIADDGFGMTLDNVIGSWLLIARSDKKRFKEQGLQTAKERTPLGDKGLGRLGTQRLGWDLEIATKTAKGKEELIVSFSWMDFFTAESLDKVDVQIAERSTKRKSGTVLTVRNLRNPERWRGSGITDLQRELSQVISPYDGVQDFTVSVNVDGTPLDLQTLNRDVRETAQLHYDIDYKAKRLRHKGQARVSFFRPNSPDERRQFERLVESDGGQRFMEHLLAAKETRDLGLRRGRGKWFVAFERSRKLTDLDPPITEDGKPADPGPFHAEIDSFDLASGADERLEVFGGLKPYRDYIKELAGVRVYRDGFRVNVDYDWLGLGSQWTSARSYYGLKPDTTTGYVAISGRDNRQLIEKTDREGFTDTPYYQTFTVLMQDFLDFTVEIQSKLRREYTSFARLHLSEAADVEPDTTPEAVTNDVSETLGQAAEIKKVAEAAIAHAEAAIARAGEFADTEGDDAQHLDQMVSSVADLHEAIGVTRGALTELQSYLSTLEDARAKTALVHEEIGIMRDQLAQSVEAMGLGLTAEALSHEMFTIADGLASRTQAEQAKLAEGGLSEPDLRRFLEHVRGSTMALRKELSHFVPSLRYVRQRRERIDIPEFANYITDYYRSRWDGQDIEIRMRNNSKAPFVVRTSRGKLTQVIDNLLLNSEYWLKVGQRQEQLNKGRVTIELRRPFIRVSDNGPGIEPAAEESLFEPFVTRKPRGEGRGLGLFVVKQLLESEGCGIELARTRNTAGRRYRFDINLSAVLHE